MTNYYEIGNLGAESVVYLPRDIVKNAAFLSLPMVEKRIGNYMGEPVYLIGGRLISVNRCAYCGQNDFDSSGCCNKCGAPIRVQKGN